jgi:hypothetical protein
LHTKGQRVVIPKTALADCETLGFEDAIKTVKTILREVVEKWPDAKLFLIGAQRKPAEGFEYEIKREVQKS